MKYTSHRAVVVTDVAQVRRGWEPGGGRVAAPFAIEARIDVQYTAKGTGLMRGLLSLRLRRVR